jgi:hypothetical protein
LSRHLSLTSHDPIRARKKAFDEDGYRLARIRLPPNGPSGTDLFPSSPPGPSIPKRCFTYRIQATDEAPNLSALDREEAQLIRHYLNRTEKSPHYGETVLHPDRGNALVGRMDRR